MGREAGVPARLTHSEEEGGQRAGWGTAPPTSPGPPPHPLSRSPFLPAWSVLVPCEAQALSPPLPSALLFLEPWAERESVISPHTLGAACAFWESWVAPWGGVA